MKIQQLYTGCLAEAAYYIESNGEAAIIDPLRETAPYLQLLEENKSKLKYIIETHFHADFVSGHVDLAKATGATIVYGPTAAPQFAAHVAHDQEILEVGNLKIKVLHTPGHTLESSCFLLFDEQNKAHCLFTGDTLFIGDVGRPDLVQKLKAEITPQILAGYLYDSIHEKIMPLADDLIIYPGHGAGSACGKNMSKETVDTLGHQKKVNYALNPKLDKNDFIAQLTEGLVEPPQYFPHNVLLNIKGTEKSIDQVVNGLQALSVDEFLRIKKNTPNAIVLDTRNKSDFAAAHIPNALFIGIDDNFAPWAGTLIKDLTTPLLLICDKGREHEAATRLSRVGYDNSVGYLQGGFEAYLQSGNETRCVEEVEATVLERLYQSGTHNFTLLDVRRAHEYESEHISGAQNFPLDFLQQNLHLLDKHAQYYVHCAGGYRSVIAISILLQNGFSKLTNIKGGYHEIKKLSLPKSEFVEIHNML